MCGIVVGIGETSFAEVTRALNRIGHRGRSGQMIVRGNDTYFGFNRLAINDKSSDGQQPFAFEQFIGVFNGEIYNADQLRWIFNLATNSKCDAEVILPLFAKFGPAVIDHLDGFYSGVIQDRLTGEIYCIRDYIGKKPLFYCWSGNRRFLTSELKAIAELDGFEVVGKGVLQLQNETMVSVRNQSIPQVAKEDLKTNLVAAVKKRIPLGEGQFGVFLSGGLDSSIVAKIVSTVAQNVVYYTLGNEESADNKAVKALAETLGITDKVRYVPLPTAALLPDLIRKVVYHTESYNPSIVSNGLATMVLSQTAFQDGINVVLTGEGADELFCGYPISKDMATWFAARETLIANLHFTELRRLDLASMAHTIEVRCPFLDRNVIGAAAACHQEDLIAPQGGKLQGKMILRRAFSSDLPNDIVERRKVSFDVGSGIRKLVVEYLLIAGEFASEREGLYHIWCDYFPSSLVRHSYFHEYPLFDEAISKRGIQHK